MDAIFIYVLVQFSNGWSSTCSIFKCFWYSNSWYSDPRCTGLVQYSNGQNLSDCWIFWYLNAIEYSGDLNTKLVRYSNGWKEAGCLWSSIFYHPPFSGIASWVGTAYTVMCYSVLAQPCLDLLLRECASIWHILRNTPRRIQSGNWTLDLSRGARSAIWATVLQLYGPVFDCHFNTGERDYILFFMIWLGIQMVDLLHRTCHINWSCENWTYKRLLFKWLVFRFTLYLLNLGQYWDHHLNTELLFKWRSEYYTITLILDK